MLSTIWKIHLSLSMFTRFVLIGSFIYGWWIISNHLKFDKRAHKKVREIDVFIGKTPSVCFKWWSSHGDNGESRFSYILKIYVPIEMYGGGVAQAPVEEGSSWEENRKNADVSLAVCCFRVSVSIYVILSDSKQVLKLENNARVTTWLISSHC